MYTLREIAEELGLSVDAVRKRVRLVADHLNGGIQRGPRGVLLLSDEAVELLRTLEEVRHQEGITLEQALARLDSRSRQPGTEEILAELKRVKWTLVALAALICVLAAVSFWR